MAVQFSQLVFSEFDADAGVPQASFPLVSFSNVFRFEFLRSLLSSKGFQRRLTRNERLVAKARIFPN